MNFIDCFKILSIISGIIFGIIGICLVAYGINEIHNNSKKKKDYVLTEGKVVDYAIKRIDGTKVYGIVAEYVVDGIDYNAFPDTYSTGIREKYPLGTRVNVWYDLKNPSECIYDIGNSDCILYIVIGVIFIILGIFAAILPYLLLLPLKWYNF